MEKILVIEDDRAVQRALERLFESEGYRVESCFDGPSGLAAFRAAPPGIVVLDLRLPGMSGSELCRTIKDSSPSVSIIVLSATADVTNKVLLLELGADDYVTKPFSPRELLARVRVATRHAGRSANPELLCFADVSVDFTRMQAKRDGSPLACTPQEFKILKFFAANQERVVTREELLNQVWGYHAYPNTRTVDNHILRLRQKMEKSPACTLSDCPWRWLQVREARGIMGLSLAAFRRVICEKLRTLHRGRTYPHILILKQAKAEYAKL
jgi:DNA-binding response OmpR family regulator